MHRRQMADGTARHRFDSKGETERPARRRVTFASSDQRERATTFRAAARNRVKGDPSLFVCDNFAFSSEVVITKRHTQFGNDRYQEGVAAAIERLNEYRELETQRILTLQSTALPDASAESVVLRAWEKGIVGTRLLRPLLDEWRKPSFDEFNDRTAWSMLAAFTHIVKSGQRRYPNRTALDVMQFQSLLST